MMRVWEPRIEGDLAYIPLSQGKWAVIDLVDLPLVRDYSWYAQVRSRGRIFYASTNTSRRVGRTKLSMHRVILGLKPGDPGPDHINHDGLDNRRSNLRLATNQQNGQNQRPRQGCSSQYKGVYWEWRRSRWRVQIQYDGKRHWLGYFNDEVEAALAYDAAAREHFGEFAAFNFPEMEAVRA